MNSAKITLEQQGFDINGRDPWAVVQVAVATPRALARLARELEQSIQQHSSRSGAYQGMRFRLRLGGSEIARADLADALAGRETWADCLRTLERVA